jgi:hypothetical protein
MASETTDYPAPADSAHIDSVYTFKALAGQARSIIGFGRFLFGAGLIGSIILPFAIPVLHQNIPLRWIWGFVIVGYIIFFRWFLKIWAARDHYTALSKRGVAFSSQTKCLSFIPWEEITKVDTRTRSGNFIVHSKSGQKICISYESDRLIQLIDLLSENLSNLARDSEPSTFYRSGAILQSHIIVILIFSGFAIVGWFVIHYWAMVFLPFTIPSLKELLTGWSKLTITPQTITICATIRRKSIPLSEIRNAVLEPVVVPNSSTALGLRLELRGKDPLTLTYFDGIFQAYLNLRQMLEKALDHAETFYIHRK